MLTLNTCSYQLVAVPVASQYRYLHVASTSVPWQLDVGTAHVFQKADAENIFVDITEAGVAANRAKGIKTTGWNEYEEYGTGRKRVETLVAMAKTASDAGDVGVGDDDDSEAADS